LLKLLEDLRISFSEVSQHVRVVEKAIQIATGHAQDEYIRTVGLLYRLEFSKQSVCFLLQ
jgi:hypothetical protein